MNILNIEHVSKVFGEKVVLDDVSYGVHQGDKIGIIGINGTGKSTILKIIGGLEEPDEGQVITQNGLRITYLPQMPEFPQGASVLDYVAEGKWQKDWSTESEARNVLNKLGITDHEEKIDHLSGGQKKRVALARTLVNPCDVLLLDEPFAAIDAKIRQELRSWLKEMIGKLGITSIFVTHDQDEAIEVADEIIITNAGRIEQKGTPIGVYRNPETAFTASFFGQPSVLKNADDFHTFAQAEGADKIIVRPEFVKISKLDEVEKFKTSVSRGVVEQVSFRGDNLELQVRVNNSVVTARRSLEKTDIREGETVNVFLYRIFALRGDSVQLIENEAVRDDFVII